MTIVVIAPEHIHLQGGVLPHVKEKVPDACFVIVGATPTRKVNRLLSLPGVRVTGTVPDVRPWVWDASVYVSPLRFGAGVKNRILEAMALGTPIVATPSSLTGTPLEDGQHALIANGMGHPYAQAVPIVPWVIIAFLRFGD